MKGKIKEKVVELSKLNESTGETITTILEVNNKTEQNEHMSF